MKNIKSIVIVLTVGLALSSCSLFRGGGGSHCPAYGSQIQENNENINNLTPEQIRLKESKSM